MATTEKGKRVRVRGHLALRMDSRQTPKARQVERGISGLKVRRSKGLVPQRRNNHRITGFQCARACLFLLRFFRRRSSPRMPHCVRFTEVNEDGEVRSLVRFPFLHPFSV